MNDRPDAAPGSDTVNPFGRQPAPRPGQRPGSHVETLRAPPSPPTIVWVMAGLFAAIEITFQLSDHGLLPWPDLRWQAVTRLGFFDLYFDALTSGEAAPPFEFWTSFLTYGFLHGGLLHLLMNSAVFLGLGGMLANTLGPVKFLVLFLFTSAMGAATWGALFSADQVVAHLVGASGALFGFIGVLKRWEWRWIALTGASSRRFTW